jgi:alpha-1,2-mannosyltransferase
MANPRRSQRVVNLGLIALLVGVGVVSFERTRPDASGQLKFDFSHFYLDASYVWEHGALPPLSTQDEGEARRLPFYLPIVPLVLAPLTAGGPSAAGLFWAAAQVAALGYSLRVLRRWTARAAGALADHGVAVMGLAVVLALPAVYDAAKFNQLSFFVLALVLAGSATLEKGHSWRGGAFLGAAAVLKLLPAIFLIWLLLKRRWTASAGFLAAAVVLAVTPCLLVFGPARTVAYHREWWTCNVGGDAVRGLVNPVLREHFIDHRNESIAQVIARLTWAEHPYRTAWQPLHWDAQTGQYVAYAVAGGLLLALAWSTRRPWPSWRSLSIVQLRTEAATYAMAMLALSPLVRTYYLVWALPGLVLMARAALGGGTGATVDRTPATAGGGAVRYIGRAGLLVWTAGMAVWMWPTARLVGVHLVMLIVLAVVLLRMTRQQAEPGLSGSDLRSLRG